MKKLYGLVLVIVMVTAVLLVNFYAWSGPQGFTTDLTRVGGFPEEDFGWSGTEYKFVEPLMKYNEAGDVYEEYTDMVVFGDSFSQGVASSWVSHFVNATGLSAQVMHYDQGGIERLIETGLYQSRPPRVVVFEILERMLKKVFRNAPVDCRLSDATVPLPVDFKPLNISLVDYRRDTSRRYGDYKLAIKILRNKLFLLTGRDKKLKPRVTQLTVGSLFSSKNSDQLLYFKGDHEKIEWPDDIAMRTRCGLEDIRERVEENGYTAFAVILAPDKLSVYSPWLVDDSLADLSLLNDEVLTAIPHSLDVMAMAIREVEQGFVDFYLPGDTHWSSKGDLQVAQWMVELFQADSTLHP